MLNVKADNLDVYERAKADDEAWEREHDSREKIERDIRGKCELNSEWVNFVTVAEAIGWLDRQAAITRRETRQSWQDAPNVLDRTNLRKIAELQSKVDELNAQNTRLNAGWAEANVRVEKLQAELVATKKSLGLAQARVHELLAERGSEPFCEQVKRWLGGDAPQECRECGDGCYRELCEAFGVNPKRTVEAVLSDLQQDTLTALGEYVGEAIDADEYRDELVNLIEHAVDELRWMGVCDE